MALTVAQGVVEVTADASGIPKRIASDIDGSQGELEAAGTRAGGSIFGAIMKSAVVLGGLAVVGNFIGGSVKGASDLNETVSKSKTIFGDFYAGIDQWTDRSAKTLGLSKEAALDAATGFGNMFSQLGFVGQAAADMSRAVVQTSADLGSFNNLETSDVAERMSAAFRGEYDSLQALIPNINAARVEQEAMAATGKTNAAELTAQEKATAVLAIVQKDGAAAAGDFAKTAEGAANKQKTMTASLEDQQAKLGGLLLPAWQGFLGFLTDTAIPALGTTIDWVSKNSDTLLMLAGVVTAAAAAYYIITTAMGIYKAFQIASAAATGGLTIAQWALNAAMTANPIGLVIVAIAALVAGIVWVATQTTFFQDVWAAMTQVIGAAWTWLWTNVLEPVFTAIGAIFTWLYENVIVYVIAGILIYVNIWAAIFTWLWTSILAPTFQAIGAVFTWLYENVIVPVVGFIVAYIQVWAAVFTWLYGNVIQPVFAAIGSAFGWIYGNVIAPTVGWINSAIGTVGDTVRTIFGGIGDFIGGVFRNLVGVLKGPINTVISFLNQAIDGANLVGGALGIHIGHIPMLAKGGTATRGGMALVGENGPEFINLPTGASVIPLDRAAPTGPGVTVKIKQKIVHSDPILAARQSAREARRYLGV